MKYVLILIVVSSYAGDKPLNITSVEFHDSKACLLGRDGARREAKAHGWEISAECYRTEMAVAP